jgi:hypothetical protein
MSDPYIDILEETASEHRKRLHDKWQQYIDYNNEMESKDPFESKVLYSIMMLSQHLFGHTMRISSNKLTDHIQEKKIHEVKKAYEPDSKDKLFVTTQMVSIVVYAIFNFVIALAGVGGVAASMMKTTADVVKGVGESGSQAFGQLHHGSKQGKQNLLNNELEHTKRLQSDHDQARRTAEEANRKHVEMMQRNEEKRHETVSQATRAL